MKFVNQSSLIWQWWNYYKTISKCLITWASQFTKLIYLFIWILYTGKLMFVALNSQHHNIFKMCGNHHRLFYNSNHFRPLVVTTWTYVIMSLILNVEIKTLSQQILTACLRRLPLHDSVMTQPCHTYLAEFWAFDKALLYMGQFSIFFSKFQNF